MATESWWSRLEAKRPWWRVYPTRRLAAAVLAAGVAWIIPGIGGPLALAVIVGLVAAVIVDYLRLPRREAITVERAAPETLGLGDSADVTYTIRSAWSWPARATLYDRVPEGTSGEMGTDEHPVPPLDERVFAMTLTGETRGRYALGPVAMRITTPLGLLARIVVTPPKENEAIAVVPSLTNVRRFRLLALQNRLSDAGVRALKLRGEGTAFAGLARLRARRRSAPARLESDRAARKADQARADDRAIADGDLADRLRPRDDAARGTLLRGSSTCCRRRWC